MNSRMAIAMQETLDSLRCLATVPLMCAVLTACGGGAETVENPLPPTGGGAGGPVYSGPTARDADVQKFQNTFWTDVREQGTCGDCHNESTGQNPMFVRFDDINLAYDAALSVVNLTEPAQSRVVEKVGQGHNCWSPDLSVCTSLMTRWIESWAGDVAVGGRTIQLTPPPIKDPGASKNFPSDPSRFASIIHQPLLVQYCAECHSSEAEDPRQPYFADPDVSSAYDAAKPRMDLDDPSASRLVERLRDEFHNCWGGSCENSANTMQAAIEQYAGGIPLTSVDDALVFSKALTLVDGTLASGGNRYENNQIALWEFKSGSEDTNIRIAADTSGVAPAIDLNLSPEVEWFGGWGITLNGGKAQGSTTASRKLYDFIQQSNGLFSVEAWVIPANVTQEMAQIVSYSAGPDARNFTLQQTLYDYDFRLRHTATGLNGDPALSTPSADEVLQASLQHVVATYDPVEGRKIFVNGSLVSNVDQVPGGTIADWQDTFAFVLGNEASNDAPWEGTIRLVAIHNAVLTPEQIQQNFDVGVGEKFFLLFDISAILQAAPLSSYILFEVQQYDSYAYLFDKPHFITLDGSEPSGIPLEGLRIGLNGAEAPVGQAFANLDVTLDASQFGELGQPLSPLGAVLPLEKGPQEDEFFLTFDLLGSQTYARAEAPMLVISPTDLDASPDVGIRTFDEINATFAAVTGVDPNQVDVDMTFQELRQSLPAVEDINTFLASHQVAIAQLAIEYCNALINDTTARNAYFPEFNFGAPPRTAFSGGVDEDSTGSNRDLFVDPLIARIVGNSRNGPVIATQPRFATVYSELAAVAGDGNRPNNLIDRLLAGGSNTEAIAKGVCAAALGNAATLIQ